MRSALLCLALVLAVTLASPAQQFALGQKVLAASGARWYPAKVVGLLEGGIYRVRYYGSDSSVEDLTADYLRPVPAAHAYREGERVFVDWERSSYEADILDWSGTAYLVHYLGYGSSYDEWVDPGRVHPHNTTYSWQAGDKVEVLWGSSWYNAVVTSADSYHNYLIHYEGWDPAYDETVSYTRVRAR